MNSPPSTGGLRRAFLDVSGVRRISLVCRRDVGRQAGQIWVMPPSTQSSMPVTQLRSSEARKEATSAPSSKVPVRPRGILLPRLSAYGGIGSAGMLWPGRGLHAGAIGVAVRHQCAQHAAPVITMIFITTFSLLSLNLPLSLTIVRFSNPDPERQLERRIYRRGPEDWHWCHTTDTRRLAAHPPGS